MNPAVFAKFPKLNNLRLADLPQTLLFSLPLPKLQRLSLKACKNFDLSNLDELKRLELLACRFKSDLPAFDKLETLSLSGLGVDTKITQFKALFSPHLMALSIRHSLGNDFSPLSAATGLRKLDLTNCGLNIDNADFSTLATLTNLEELNLAHNEISNLSFLSGMTKLKVLDLSFNRWISSLAPLSKLTELHTIYLVNSLPFIERDITSFLAPLTALKKLKKVNLVEF